MLNSITIPGELKARCPLVNSTVLYCGLRSLQFDALGAQYGQQMIGSRTATIISDSGSTWVASRISQLVSNIGPAVLLGSDPRHPRLRKDLSSAFIPQ